MNAIGRSIVVGCGISGIAAAAALRPHCDEILILERDALPATPKHRRGVPQGGQLHNLLSCAHLHLEQLLPGFTQALRDAGAGDARVSTDTHVFELGVRMPERDLGMRLMCAPRPVIEHVARQLLLEGGQIEIQERARAVGLEIADAGTAAGVTVETNGVRRALAGEVVVDASGRRSEAPHWLTSMGHEAPRADVARVDYWYVSMTVERPPSWIGAPDFWLVFPTPPRTRGGLVSPLGGNRWYVSVSGRTQDTPPRDPNGVRAYAATLEDPSIAELLADAVPASPPKLFRKLSATWRRYDLLADPVSGFLPLGDSIASLNPLFGQGISLVAWQASELARALDELQPPVTARALRALTSRYLERSADSCRAAWTLGELIRGPDAVSPPIRPEQFAGLARAIENDPDLHRLYVGIWHLLEPASSLERPDVARRLEAARSPA